MIYKLNLRSINELESGPKLLVGFLQSEREWKREMSLNRSSNCSSSELVFEPVGKVGQ